MNKLEILREVWGDEKLEPFADFIEKSPLFIATRGVITEEDYLIAVWSAFTHGYGTAVDDIPNGVLAVTQEALFEKAREFLNGYMEKLNKINFE